jgi:CHAD domain-containing protein
VRKHPSPEAFHATRVATRRLRAALRLLEDARGTPRAHREATALGRVGRRVGRVRDLDIVIARMEALRAGKPPGEDGGLEHLLGYLTDRREHAGRRVVRHLSGKRFEKLEKRLRRLASRTGGRLETAGAVVALGKAVLSARAERLLALDARIGTADVEELHRLRIRVKRFRYTLELLGDRTAPHEALLAAAAAVQTHLGDLNARVVAARVIDRYLGRRADSARPDPGSALVEIFGAERQRLRSGFAPVWRAFARALTAWLVVEKSERERSNEEGPGVKSARRHSDGPGVRRAAGSVNQPSSRAKRA